MLLWGGYTRQKPQVLSPLKGGTLGLHHGATGLRLVGAGHRYTRLIYKTAHGEGLDPLTGT